METIPSPPAPAFGVMWTAGAVAGGILLGLLLAFWGRTIGRVLLGLAAAGVGVGTGPMLAAAFGWPVLATRLAAAITFGLLALVLARLIWAAVAAALIGGAADAAVIVRHLRSLPAEKWPVFGAPSDANLLEWGNALATFARDSFLLAWGQQPEWLIIAAVAVAIGPVILALVRPRLAVIVLSSLLGAVLVVASAAVAVATFRPSVWEAQLRQWYLLPALAGGVMLIGITFQYIRAVAADRRKRKKAEAADKGKTPSARSAEKG